MNEEEFDVVKVSKVISKLLHQTTRNFDECMEKCEKFNDPIAHVANLERAREAVVKILDVVNWAALLAHLKHVGEDEREDESTDNPTDKTFH